MRKVLFVSETNPFSRKVIGGTVGGQKNYEALKRYFGIENVYLALITNEIVDETRNLLCVGKHRSKIEYLMNTILLWNCFNKKALLKIIDFANKNEINEIFFDGSIFGRVAKAAKKNNKYIYIYYHNVEKDFANILVKKNGIKYLFQYFSYWYNEKLSSEYGDKLIAINKRDANLISNYYKKAVDECVPVTYKDRFDEKFHFQKNFDKKILLFVGSAGLKANVDSIFWFKKEVCRKLDSSQYVLNVVGRGFEKYKSVLESDTINVIGTVANIDSFYYEADIVVYPILYGCGMKTKTAEAMMFGKTILATSEALVGYEYENVEGIFECNTIEEYVSTLSNLFKLEVISLKSDVRKLFLSKYEEQQTIKIYERIFDSNNIPYS